MKSLKITCFNVLLPAVLVICLLASSFDELQAQDMREMPLVYTQPGMESVDIQNGLTYVTSDGEERLMDLYLPSPSDSGELPGAVIFALGYADFRLNEMQSYINWGQLAALNGMAGVTYRTGEPENDLPSLVAYLREHADELGIDGERIGIWSCSGNVPVALNYLSTAEYGSLKFSVFYYGIMPTPDRAYHDEIASLSESYGFAYPEMTEGQTYPGELPTMVVRSGRDDIPHINETQDHFLSSMLASNGAITYINHHEGRHAFDIYDDTPESRRIIRQTLDFMKANLSQLP